MGQSDRKNKNTFKHSSRKRVEIDEEALQKIFLGKELPIGDVARKIQQQNDAEPIVLDKTITETKTELPAPADGSGHIRIPAKKDSAARF